MKRLCRKILLYMLIIIGINSYSEAQVILPSKEIIKVNFSKSQVDIIPNKTVFNVLNITNISPKDLVLTINFIIPKGWNLIGQNNEKILLLSQNTINLPVLLAVTTDTKGGIGYTVVASIIDETGTNIKSEYCYLTVPPKHKIDLNLLGRTQYFDNETKKAVFGYKIENKGNINELIQVELNFDKSIKPMQEKSSLVSNIELESKADTVIEHEVSLSDESSYGRNIIHKAMVHITSKDTSISRSVMFKYLDYYFRNEISETQHPLVVELNAHNIFARQSVTYSGLVFGRILLKQDRELFYYFRSWQSTRDFWKRSEFYVGYNSKKFYMLAGDVKRNVEQFFLGRGLHIQKRYKNSAFGIIGTENKLLPIRNYGATFSFQARNKFNAETGVAYQDNNFESTTSQIAYIKFSLPVIKQTSILAQIGANLTSSDTTNNVKTGLGYKLDVTSNRKRLSFVLRNHYGNQYYCGYSRGVFNITSQIRYKLTDRKIGVFSYHSTFSKPVTYLNDQLYASTLTRYHQLSLQYGYFYQTSWYFYTGPIFENQSTNSYYIRTTNDFFAVNSYKYEIGLKYSSRQYYNTINASFRHGVNDIYQYDETIGVVTGQRVRKNPLVQSSLFTLALKRKYWGVYSSFYIGPHSLPNYYNYLVAEYYGKIFYFIPYYERFLYRNILKTSLRATYMYDISMRQTRFYVSNQLSLELKKGWSFRLTTNFARNSKKDPITGSNYVYNDTYFEFTIRKVFDWKQPRLKYFNVETVFYKDLNGNRFKDANEPGVNGVLVNIERSLDSINYNPDYKGEFASVELLSNSKGQIIYENIPEGHYGIKYNPIREIKGDYTTLDAKKEIEIKRDTVVFIPFTEKNKVFGKIILNRDKFSALGDISLSNIRIEAVDGIGTVYSTLTKDDGTYELYTPISDYYTVTIKNIFSEYFELMQDKFILKFNGYKQFELNFEFNERKRDIKFDDSFVYEDEEFTFEKVKQIKQTVLKGVVRDATSSLPIQAKIFIINSKTLDEVAMVRSNLQTGNYYVSFVAGDKYKLVVKADGYWIYEESLYINQITTFENITRDIMLSKIIPTTKIETPSQIFAEGKSELSAEARIELDNLLSLLFSNNTIRIEIAGHTDGLESKQYNAQKLSEDRAKAVANYLNSHGLPASRYEIKAYSDKQPQATNESSEGRQRNRRVDINIIAY